MLLTALMLELPNFFGGATAAGDGGYNSQGYAPSQEETQQASEDTLAGSANEGGAKSGNFGGGGSVSNYNTLPPQDTTAKPVWTTLFPQEKLEVDIGTEVVVADKNKDWTPSPAACKTCPRIRGSVFLSSPKIETWVRSSAGMGAVKFGLQNVFSEVGDEQPVAVELLAAVRLRTLRRKLQVFREEREWDAHGYSEAALEAARHASGYSPRRLLDLRELLEREELGDPVLVESTVFLSPRRGVGQYARQKESRAAAAANSPVAEGPVRALQKTAVEIIFEVTFPGRTRVEPKVTIDVLDAIKELQAPVEANVHRETFIQRTNGRLGQLGYNIQLAISQSDVAFGAPEILAFSDTDWFAVQEKLEERKAKRTRTTTDAPLEAATDDQDKQLETILVGGAAVAGITAIITLFLLKFPGVVKRCCLHCCETICGKKRKDPKMREAELEAQVAKLEREVAKSQAGTPKNSPRGKKGKRGKKKKKRHGSDSDDNSSFAAGSDSDASTAFTEGGTRKKVKRKKKRGASEASGSELDDLDDAISAISGASSSQAAKPKKKKKKAQRSSSGSSNASASSKSSKSSTGSTNSMSELGGSRPVKPKRRGGRAASAKAKSRQPSRAASPSGKTAPEEKATAWKSAAERKAEKAEKGGKKKAIKLL